MESRRILLLLAMLALGVVAVGCCFGFLATFEPLDGHVAWRWRALYGGLGAVSIAGVALGVARLRRRATGR